MQFVLRWLLLALVLVKSTRSIRLSEISLKEEKIDNNYTDTEVCNNQRITLDFSNIDLPEIGDNFLASPLITCLNLHGNSINRISPSAFDKLPSLTYLDLSNNAIVTDNILSGRGHETLKILILDNALRNSWGDSTLTLTLTGTFPSLEKLYVRYNNDLGIIKGDNSGDFSKLMYLYLSNNNIQEFRNTHRSYEYDWLPKSLKYLELDNNHLRSLSLSDLPNLTFLSINNNKLNYLKLYNLNFLKHFSACDNQIYQLSYDEFQGTPELEDLYLSNNQISNFDGLIVDSIPNLQNLSLDNNLLTDVPEIRDAPKLHTLSLRCNKIEQLKSNHFSGMPNLRILHLDNNRIVKIHSNSFSNLEKLEILSLGRNQLTNLPSQWMLKMQSLRFLHLENNQFTNLEDLHLDDIPSLMQLFLQNNQLKYLKANSLDSVPENITIELDTSLTTVKNCKVKENDY